MNEVFRWNPRYPTLHHQSFSPWLAPHSLWRGQVPFGLDNLTDRRGGIHVVGAAGYPEPCGGGIPSGFRDPEAVLGEGAVRSGMEPLFAQPLLVAAPALVFLALPGRLTFDWVDPRTLTKEGEREASPL